MTSNNYEPTLDVLTFEEWRNTRKIMGIEETVETMNIDADMFEGMTRVYIYGGEKTGVYLCETEDGQFHTHIERDEYFGSLREIEHTLFLQWAVIETLEWNNDVACDWLETFCAFYGYEPQSADEILHELLSIEPAKRDWKTNNHIAWLEWFCERWAEYEAEEEK